MFTNWCHACESLVPIRKYPKLIHKSTNCSPKVSKLAKAYCRRSGNFVSRTRGCVCKRRNTVCWFIKRMLSNIYPFHFSVWSRCPKLKDMWKQWKLDQDMQKKRKTFHDEALPSKHRYGLRTKLENNVNNTKSKISS